MKIRDIIVTAMLVTMSPLAGAQQAPPGKNLEEYLEYLVEIGFSEYEVADFSEDIASLEFNPVDLNMASKNDLSRLFFLSSFQINSIIKYIRDNGAIRSKYELSYISGFDKELAQLCSNYVVIREKDSGFNRRSRTIISSAIIFSDRDTIKYPGSDLKYSTRLTHQSGSTSIGLCIEKDKGEKLITERYTPEFLSGHIQIELPGPETHLIVGDYRVRFGQGLAIWHGYSPGISPVNSRLIRGSSRITPYYSSDENNFFRGLALSSKIRSTDINIYLSANKIDANTEEISDSIFVIRSLYDNGIHNTEITESKRDVLNEYSAGINLNRNFRHINIGWSIIGTMFSESIVPYETTETVADFTGQKNLTTSLDYAASLNKIYLYGEAAITGRGRPAFLQGIKMIPAERAKLNLIFGYTPRSYNSFHGHIFGKETVNNFRKSFLANIELDLAPGTTLYSGVIYHSELWYGYRSAEFPRSIRYITEILWKPSDMINIKFSFRYREKSEDISVDRGIDLSSQTSINTSRLHLDLSPLQGLRLSSRFEMTSSPETGEKGYLAYQGVRIDPDRFPITCIFRFYTYSIESYNNRIYAWEDDLLFNPSVPCLYGKGNRNYFVIDYHPEKFISCRFKYGLSHFKRSGQEHMFNEYRLQIRIRFTA